MKVKLFILTVLAVLALPSAVQAHMLGHTKSVAKMTLAQQAAWYTANAHHAESFLEAWGGITAWQLVSSRNVHTVTPASVGFHRKLLANSLRHLRLIEHQLLLILIPHYDGWMCLHRYESTDWYNRDSGHNGHYGGLQMTYRWLGLISGYAYELTPFQQMLAAETGYRNSHYSRAWLSGQWSTLYHCSNYF